jgi:diaminohydroxyphosphoribosylaminopyrimidine deaminase/5-amino-6-(5-phosphoribosylamino)uracil reductase
MTPADPRYMRRALALARRGVGRTSPNPAVGCVIVRDGLVVGEGWHRQAGTPHAEVHALWQAGDRARGGDVYVTLEPCSHHGRTPPCADALVAAGVGRVFAGMTDPNPKVMGEGLARLRAAGIEAESGLLEEECRRLNEPFIKQITTGLPFVTYKTAMTLDGRIATAGGDSRWVTGERSRRYVHRLRDRSDAIMVGVGTVLADDPLLTCRLAGGRDPLRVVVDSRLRTPVTARVIAPDSGAATLIATLPGNDVARFALEEAGAEVIVCGPGQGGIDLPDLLARLGRRGVQSLLLEGGSGLAGAFLHQGLIDRYLIFIAPKLVGGEGPGPFAGQGVERMAEAAGLAVRRLVRFGGDIMVEAYPCSRD